MPPVPSVAAEHESSCPTVQCFGIEWWTVVARPAFCYYFMLMYTFALYRCGILGAPRSGKHYAVP
jgi:hypothetical protein